MDISQEEMHQQQIVKSQPIQTGSTRQQSTQEKGSIKYFSRRNATTTNSKTKTIIGIITSHRTFYLWRT